jgi:hypothetical protein
MGTYTHITVHVITVHSDYISRVVMVWLKLNNLYEVIIHSMDFILQYSHGNFCLGAVYLYIGAFTEIQFLTTGQAYYCWLW